MGKTTDSKQYFVIMWQGEIEQFAEGQHNERLIYESIKSHSGNGKLEVALSFRDISKRANISYSSVSRFLPSLLDKGVVKVTGSKSKIGGKVNIYKVLLPETVSVANRNTYSKESVAEMQKSVADSKESVASSGVKPRQSNKVSKVIDGSDKFSLLFLEEFNKDFGTTFRDTEKRKALLKQRLKRYTLVEILSAVMKMSQNSFYQGNNDSNWRADPDYILKSDEQIDKFLNMKEKDKFSITPF